MGNSSFKKIKTALLAVWEESSKVSSGFGRPVVVLDMLMAYFQHGASPRNYVTFGFKGMCRQQREKFFTYKMNQNLMSGLNDKASSLRMVDKYLFSLDFSEYLGREILGGSVTSKNFNDFLAVHKKVVVKPRKEAQGR